MGIVSLDTSMYPSILDYAYFNFTSIFGRETPMYLVTERQHLLLLWQDAQTCSYDSTELRSSATSSAELSLCKGSGY